MFALQTCLMEEQIAQSQELQRLLGLRAQKLQELLEVEHQIERVAEGYKSSANAVTSNHPNPSTIVREENEDENSDESDDDSADETKKLVDALEYDASAGKVLRRGRPPKTEGLSQDQSLSALITACLAGKKMGEKLDAITLFCLRAGYQSSAKDFSQVVRQTLYNLRAKKVVLENKASRRFILN